jgi:hypothetical protein
MSFSLSTLVLASACISEHVWAFYAGTPVVELTGKNFDKQVFGDTNVWMVRQTQNR